MGAPSGVGAALGAETSAPARLLAASVLSFCFLLTGAQTGTMPITVDPAKPIEGQSVSLTPAAIPANSVTCRWHRGADVSTLILIYYLPPKSAQTLGPGYTGRESMKADCSLHISNLNVTDSGKYGVTIDGPGVFETGEVDIEVSEAPGGGGGGSGLSGGAIAGIVIGCLAAVILIGGLLYYLCTKTSLGRTERHAANGNIPSAPGHNQGVTDTKPRTGEEDIQYSTLAFNANNPPQPAPGATQPLDSNIIYSEIKKK